MKFWSKTWCGSYFAFNSRRRRKVGSGKASCGPPTHRRQGEAGRAVGVGGDRQYGTGRARG